eukprot:Rmarinus@m.7679
MKETAVAYTFWNAATLCALTAGPSILMHGLRVGTSTYAAQAAAVLATWTRALFLGTCLARHSFDYDRASLTVLSQNALGLASAPEPTATAWLYTRLQHKPTLTLWLEDYLRCRVGAVFGRGAWDAGSAPTFH